MRGSFHITLSSCSTSQGDCIIVLQSVPCHGVINYQFPRALYRHDQFVTTISLFYLYKTYPFHGIIIHYHRNNYTMSYFFTYVNTLLSDGLFIRSTNRWIIYLTYLFCLLISFLPAWPIMTARSTRRKTNNPSLASRIVSGATTTLNYAATARLEGGEKTIDEMLYLGINPLLYEV